MQLSKQGQLNKDVGVNALSQHFEENAQRHTVTSKSQALAGVREPGPGMPHCELHTGDSFVSLLLNDVVFI